MSSDLHPYETYADVIFIRLWTAESKSCDNTDSSISNPDHVAEGHLLSFADALSTVLDKLLLVALIPRWILGEKPARFGSTLSKGED